MKQYLVYILKCADNSYYTGVTEDLERRMNEHHSGLAPDSYTGKRRPVELVYFTEFTFIDKAIAFEKQVKGWTRRKKEALIAGNWEKLKEYAACENETSHLLRVPKSSFDSGSG